MSSIDTGEPEFFLRKSYFVMQLLAYWHCLLPQWCQCSLMNIRNYLRHHRVCNLTRAQLHPYGSLMAPFSNLDVRRQATILVADDDPLNSEFLQELLSASNYQVVTVPDGAAALEEFGRLQPDLVILDVMMPHFTGFEVCEQIKDNLDTRLTPVILVTGLSEKEDKVRGIKAGADDFLTRPVDRSELLARVTSLLHIKAYTDELERAEAVLFALARSIEGKDPYTQGHCERLAHYAAILGESLSLPQDQITALKRAGVVHDIGKVAVPDAILLKPTQLTEAEWKIMEEHPIVGERICAPLKSFRLVLPIIRHHHEKVNGTGYPDHLKEEQIPLTARILTIVDVYDALTTARPYKRALTHAETLQTMQEEVSKGWWDPYLFNEFRTLVLNGRMTTPTLVLMQEQTKKSALLTPISQLTTRHGDTSEECELNIERSSSELAGHK